MMPERENYRSDDLEGMRGAEIRAPMQRGGLTETQANLLHCKKRGGELCRCTCNCICKSVVKYMCCWEFLGSLLIDSFLF